MIAAIKVKMSGSKKKVNKNTYKISSIKLITKKFLEVLIHVVFEQNNGKEIYKKKCAARAKLFFC